MCTLMIFFSSVKLTAQVSTINTTVGSTGYVGTNNDGANSFITFTVQNNSGIDIEIIEVARWSDAAYNGSTNTLWASSGSLSGPPGALANPTWSNVAQGIPTGLTGGLQVNPVITGMSFTIPQGQTWRFALHTTATNHYSGGTSSPTPNNFTVAGVTLTTGDFQIAGQNTGYGGAKTPRYFTGYIKFKPKAIPCVGVPSNAVIQAPKEICPNKPFTVNVGLANGLLITGITYQYQYSTNGISWTNWAGTVNANGSINDAIVVPTWYRCNIVCIASGQAFTTPAHKVDIAPFYYCYCDGSFATTAAGVDVGNMSVTALPSNEILLNNGNASPALNNTNSNKSYSDFRYTVPPVPMYHDSTYLIDVSQIGSAAAFTASKIAVYIDFNRNGTFDVAERILLSGTTQLPPFPGKVSANVTVPSTAQFGLTGMRVILVAGNADPDTCLDYGNGETEDYLVDLRHLPCSGKPTPGVVRGDTSMCKDYDYVLLDSTYQKQRHGLTHSWQESADGVFWNDIPNTDGKDTLMRLFTGQPLHYRLRQVCTFTNDTAYANHKVNLKPAYKCYCHSQSLGTDKDSSDVGGFAIYKFEVTDGGAHLMNPRAVRKRQDYTDLQPIEMWVDSIYQFRVFHTMPNDFHADAKVTVFMDFDNDRQYDLPGERVFTGFTNVNLHTLIKNIIVPDSVVVDVPTGLRIVINNDVAPNAASDEGCGTYVSGETEDYMMIFRRAFPVGVHEVKGVKDINIFPNPTSGKFSLHFNSGKGIEKVQVNVSTITGQRVMQKQYTHGGGRFLEEIDMGNQPKGVYMVELDADGERSTMKVVVQ